MIADFSDAEYERRTLQVVDHLSSIATLCARWLCSLFIEVAVCTVSGMARLDP